MSLSRDLQILMNHKSPPPMDFESSLRQGKIIQQMLDEHGINPFAMYCSITGEEIGILNPAQMQLIWSAIDLDTSDDQIIDELWARVISSMRPSPAWNYIKRETIDRLRFISPRQVCAYLLGRYYMPRDRAYSRLARSFEDKVYDGMNRIKACQLLNQMEMDEDQLDRFIGALLLLDAQFGLNRITLSLPLSPFDLDFSKPDEIIDALEKCYSDLVHEKAKLERQAKLHATFFAEGGNRLVRHAAMKHSIELRPKTEAVLKREETKKRVAVMTDLLANLMKGSIPASPVIQPIKFGLKLNQINRG